VIEEESQPADAVRHVENYERRRDYQQQIGHVVIALTTVTCSSRLRPTCTTKLLLIIVMMTMMIEGEGMMITSRGDIWWRLAGLVLLAAGGVKVAPVTGAVPDAAEDGRVESHNDKHRRHDAADDDERHVEDDVDVRFVRQDVTVRQPTARPVVHDADGEGRKAREDGAGDGFSEDHSTSV